MSYKKYLLLFAIILVIIIVFTGIDYIVHSLDDEYTVPSYYFRNKIVFGTIIGYFTLLLSRQFKLWKRALIVSAVVSVLLQTRYYIEGYSINFVLEFLLFHFLMLFPVALIVFKMFESVISKKNS